eukprot:10193899-Alexandrium_andersonii.AAC.1
MAPARALVPAGDELQLHARERFGADGASQLLDEPSLPRLECPPSTRESAAREDHEDAVQEEVSSAGPASSR